MPKVILFIDKILSGIFFAVKKNSYLPFVFLSNPQLKPAYSFFQDK